MTLLRHLSLASALCALVACGSSADNTNPVDECQGVTTCSVSATSCSGEQLVTCAPDANGCLVSTTEDCALNGESCDDSAAPAVCVASCDALRCMGLSAGDGFCDASVPVLCEADSAGCLVESAGTACGNQVCDASAAAPLCIANASGDSCAQAFLVQDDIALTGTDIRDDFTHVEAFDGMGCALTGEIGTPVEAIFAVELKAGETVSLSEHGDLDAVLGILPTCESGAACLAAEGNFGAESTGITYTAQTDETVFAYVSAFSDFSGDPPFSTDYDIRFTISECGDLVTEGPEQCDDNDVDRDGCTECRVDLGFECDNSSVSVCTGPEDLGSYAATETIPDTSSVASLDKDGVYFYRITFTENVLISGTLDASGGEDIDIGFFDLNDSLMFSSEAVGGEAWSDQVLVAGTYTIAILAFEAAPSGWTLTMSTKVGPVCGDGVVGVGEVCDDNNSVDQDGCTACTVDLGYVCDGASPSLCVDSCGNGTVEPGDECDDGNNDDLDRCSNACLLTYDVADQDGNDSFVTAQELTSGQVARGSLDPSGSDQFDLYKFTLVERSWVTLEVYTSIDADTSNYGGAGLDSTMDCQEDPDLHIFDESGDPTDDTTNIAYDDASGTFLCGYLGPNTADSAVLLAAGTYYVKVSDFSNTSAIPHYALDFKVDAILASTAACDPALDLCDRTNLLCSTVSNTCASPVEDRANYEQFTAGQFDLSNTALHFAPVGDRFDVTAIPATTFPDVPGTGTVASSQPALGNDASVSASLGFGFPFFGGIEASVFINSNGNLSFGLGDSEPQESSMAHFRLPRVSFFFDDLRPDLGGSISLDEYANHLTVTFVGVPGASGTVSVQVQLFASGAVVMTYLDVTETTSIVGISAGDNALNPPAPTNFSAQLAGVPGAGDLVINEIMANPNTVSDTNCDTVFSSTRDEFLEIVNVSGATLDLTDVTITDNFTVRHTFGPMILADRQAVVVYGGGTPSCLGVLGVTSSTGLLALNNGGDTLTLRNSSQVVIDAATYTSSIVGISRTRDADLVGPFTNHDVATGGVGNYSPGFRVTGQSF